MGEPRWRRKLNDEMVFSMIKLFPADMTFIHGEDVENFSVSADLDFSTSIFSGKRGIAQRHSGAR